MTNVVPFRRARYCASCGQSYVQLRTHHRYCRRCIAWHYVGLGIYRTKRALGRARP